MSHRIEIQSGPRASLRVVFEGELDAAALSELKAVVATRTAPGVHPCVFLRSGTTVERFQLEALRALDAEIVAESPYLARWLSDAGTPPRSAR